MKCGDRPRCKGLLWKRVKRFLTGKTVPEEAEPNFEIWKTVKIGTGLENGEDFRRALNEGNYWFNLEAWKMLEDPAFKVAAEETELALVKVTPAKLGFKKGGQRDRMYHRAQKRGLEPCPAEVGPQLRVQYPDQVEAEEVSIAMEPILIAGGPCVFNLSHHDSRLWLRCYLVHPHTLCKPDEEWVFCRPRK